MLIMTFNDCCHANNYEKCDQGNVMKILDNNGQYE